jgi:DNA-binding PadR family transcriptional regulator
MLLNIITDHPVICAMALIALTLIICYNWIRRVSTLEYLKVLDQTEWIPGRQIVDRLHELKGFRINYGTFYTTMRRLKEEGLVEDLDSKDEDGPRRSFRLTHDGIRKLEHLTREAEAKA